VIDLFSCYLAILDVKHSVDLSSHRIMTVGKAVQQGERSISDAAEVKINKMNSGLMRPDQYHRVQRQE
jgi:hypothetical protein